jgi:pyroglutamyl-peptidase
MRNQLLFLLGAMVLQIPAQAAETAPLHLLLTSFDPFGGSTTNNTQPVVAYLKAHAADLGNNITVDTCNLPVIYNVAAQDALNCIDQYKPDVVISFGEGMCTINIESAATNLDNSPWEADNAGNTPVNTPIIPGGPERSSFYFPVQAMYCAIGSSSVTVEPSTDPGAFICNNTAYRLSLALGQKTPFTFIHVPNSQCAGDADIQPIGATVAQMLNAAIANLRAPAVPNSPWPHPGNTNLLPTDAASTQTLENTLSASNAPACEQNYAAALAQDYSNSD